ncbi:MAG: DUF4040 domain-containing protein [bacterium]|nr:MAG: DUF4040 domain-containing protein [bacterium]
MEENSQERNAVDFLLEEYKYLADSFWKNEETGDKRVNFFITLVTAVIAALVALATSDKGYLEQETIRLLTIFSLVSLLSFGIFTLLRMIRRNQVTDEYKTAMDSIRDIFRQFDYEKLKDYYPFGKNQKKRKYWRGGLAETTALINSVIVAAIFALLTVGYQNWLVAVHALVVFGLVLAIQFLFLSYCYGKRKSDNKNIELKRN